MKKICIFFFSGTGNAKRVALWIAESAAENGIGCHLYNISHEPLKRNPDIDSDALLIFISPIHGFNYPKITLDFIRTFPGGNNRVVLMNTRGGMKIGSWVTPGLTGIAFYLSSFWLRNKGYRITGQIPYDMPSNWISLHPALNENTVQYIHQTNNDRLKKHFRILLEGKKLFLSRKEIIQDVLVAPVSLLYYFAGRFIIAKTFYANQHCNNCGTCIKECPVSAIKQIKGRPFWTIHCESCMHCMNFCPHKAIDVSHSLLALTFILYTVIMGVFYRYALKGFELHFLIKLIIANLVFFFILLLLYRVQHLLLKNKMAATIIAHISLTYYQFWGRYQSMADKEWKKP